MFRKATEEDVDRIAEIYDEIHTENEAGRMTTNWIRGVYPSKETAMASVRRRDMFVEEEQGRIVAAARINQEQVINDMLFPGPGNSSFFFSESGFWLLYGEGQRRSVKLQEPNLCKILYDWAIHALDSDFVFDKERTVEILEEMISGKAEVSFP